MFLHLSVILLTGAIGFPACITGHITGGGGCIQRVSASRGRDQHPGGSAPRAERVCIQGVCTGGVCIRGVCIRGGSVRLTVSCSIPCNSGESAQIIVDTDPTRMHSEGCLTQTLPVPSRST